MMRYRVLDREQGSLTVLTSLEIAGKNSKLRVAGTVLLMLGLYVNIPLSLGNGVVPSVSAVPGLIMLLLFPRVMPPRIYWKIIAASLVFLAIGVITVEVPQDFQARINATAQFSLALSLGIAGGRAVALVGKRKVHVVCAALLFLLLLGSALEVAGLLRPLTEAFLALYPREYDLQSLADRDVGIAGGVRPFLFTAETSYLATSTVIAIVGYVWSGERPSRYPIALIYAVALILVIRSPLIMFAIIITIASLFTDRSLRRDKYFLITLIGSVALIGMLAVAGYGGSLYESRLKSIRSGADYSVTYRTYGSMLAAIRVADEYPIIGIGPGDLSPASIIIMDTAVELGVPSGIIEEEWRSSVTSVVPGTLIYFGYLGGLAILYVFIAFVRKNSVETSVALWITLAFVTFSTGAFYAPSFLSAAIILVALNNFKYRHYPLPTRRLIGWPPRRAPMKSERGRLP